MRRSVLAAALVVVAGGVGMVGGRTLEANQQDEPNYMIVATWTIPPGAMFSELQEELATNVRIWRQSGNYKSVRLFSHRWGPELAFYIVYEPNSWEVIGGHAATLFEARPELLNSPGIFAGHSDNIMGEIIVN